MFTLFGKEINSVGILGGGKSNIGVLDYLSSRGFDFSLTLRSNKKTEIKGYNPDRVFFDNEALNRIDEDILFLSPSARRDSAKIATAKERGVIISSDAELFFHLTKSPVFAITGSDGKSTTTHLASKLLCDTYPRAIAAGNIGRALSPYISEPNTSAVITELSSFQLNYFKPKTERCVITNITKNHLNWHTDFDEYINAKKNILENSKERIICFDCEVSRKIARDFPLFAVFSTVKSGAELKRLIKADLYITLDGGKISVSGEPVLSLSDIAARGKHNVLNFMGAIAMSWGLFKPHSLTKLAREFRGLAHRCEFVGEKNGVRYYDSSIDSSPKRCAATLNMLNGQVIVILGGRSKGLDFTELLPTLKERAKFVILTGECAPEIESVILEDVENSLPYKTVPDFFDAIEYATCLASPGDAVLLSPAATSYDRFLSFEERGDAFKSFLKSKGI